MLLVKRSNQLTLGQIVEVPIDSIKEWKNNPRKNDSAAKKLIGILNDHGQVTPVVVWIQNRVIYKGNTTWKALKARGDTTIKAIFVNFPSEQAAIAYGIADNKSSEFADWDDEILKKFLTVDSVKGSGFSEMEATRIFSSVFDKRVDVDSIGEYDEEQDTFTVKVENVRPSDKDHIVALINRALEGLEYAARAH